MFEGHGFGGGGMWIFWILIIIALIGFDYKIQNGITHKMNATLLMKQMGI